MNYKINYFVHKCNCKYYLQNQLAMSNLGNVCPKIYLGKNFSILL